MDLEKNGEPSSPAPPTLKTIPIYLINGVGTIWDAQTAATLHCVHSVSGLRVGTLPGVAQQNGFLGLPITLMQEETAYLVRQGIAHLVPLQPAPLPNPTKIQSSTRPLPSIVEVEAHTQARVARYRALEEAAREDERKRQSLSREAFEKGGEKARLKREARAKRKAENAGAGAGAGAAPAGGVEGAQGLGAEEKSKGLFGGGEHVDVDERSAEGRVSTQSTHTTSATASTTTTTIALATISPGYFLPIPSHPSFPSLALPHPSAAIQTIPDPSFPFPRTPRDQALLATYTSLQSQGYRMGLGPRFGGEYLIYPGDYLRYHAHFTSQVIVDDEPIRPAEIVAWGRLGTGTKKAGLICCWDQGEKEHKGEVEFYSLEWANFG